MRRELACSQVDYAVADVHDPRVFTSFLNLGLQAFPMRVELNLEWSPGKDMWEGWPSPDLYSVICLQLANDMADNGVYRMCANETCRRRFVRQLGRAERGQHRNEGVMYCSKSCAKAQGERDRRRKKRAAAENGPTTNSRRPAQKRSK